MTIRNEISYDKAYSLINAYKKQIESNSMNKNIYNNESNLKLVDKSIKQTPTNFSNNPINHYNLNKSNTPSGRNTPKYSSNILSKKENSGLNNNTKLGNSENNGFSTGVNNNENNNINEDIDNKGNISIKFINHNINHFIISNNNKSEGYQNPKQQSNNSIILNKPNANNIINFSNNFQSQLPRDSQQKPEKKSKKINAFRNVAKPQTVQSNPFINTNKELSSKSNVNDNLNRIQNSKNNIKNPDYFDMYQKKNSNTPNNQNYGTSNYNNVMVNYSQQLQPIIFSKYNIKQLNINNGEFSPVNRVSRGSMGLHSTLNKSNNNNSLQFSKQENIQYSRPSSASNSKNKPINNHIREKSSNSLKEPYNNPSIIATIKRNPSTNSLAKSLTRNYSKPSFVAENSNVNNNNNSSSRGVLNLNKPGVVNFNRQTPKNYSGSLDRNKSGELARSSLNSLNMIGIEKPNTGNKIITSNNLNIKAPTLNR